MELLTIHNYRKLEPWTKKYGWGEYNSNIHTMLMWNHVYPIYFKIYDHFALVCFEYKQKKHWFMPFSKKEYLKQSLDTLLQCSNEYHIPKQIHGLTKEAKKILQLYYPNDIYFEYHPNGEDYVYDRFMQQSLSGKKIQKRRNHFNAFLNEYKDHFTYHKISKEDYSNIYELLKTWQSFKEESISIKREEEAINYLLENFDVLDLKGICIYINGKLEAFNIASTIDEKTIQIHVEKANTSIRGLSVAILKYFLETLDSSILYVNREDDMGLESLRKAKHDMRPLFKIQKFLGVFEDTKVVHPKIEDVEEMKKLWLRCFPDEDDLTANFYFQHIFKIENAYIIRNKYEIMAMAFINPWEMSIHKKIKNISFIEGVCVHEDYRNCGLMHRLITSIRTEKQIYALQAYNWDLYKSLGFKETHYLKTSIVDKIECSTIQWTSIHPETMVNIYNQFTIEKDAYRIHDVSYYKNYYLPYMEACGYTTKQYEEKGYVTFYKEEEYIHITTIHYDCIKTLHCMLSTLLQEYKKPLHVTTSLDITLSENKSIKPSLMMYPYEKIENAYINEIL